MLGRQFDGMGHVLDDKGPLYAADYESISRKPDNPLDRKSSDAFLTTGFSSIDLMMPMGLGQNRPVFRQWPAPQENGVSDD